MLDLVFEKLLQSKEGVKLGGGWVGALWSCVRQQGEEPGGVMVSRGAGAREVGDSDAAEGLGG